MTYWHNFVLKEDEDLLSQFIKNLEGVSVQDLEHSLWIAQRNLRITEKQLKDEREDKEVLKKEFMKFVGKTI